MLRLCHTQFTMHWVDWLQVKSLIIPTLNSPIRKSIRKHCVAIKYNERVITLIKNCGSLVSEQVRQHSSLGSICGMSCSESTNTRGDLIMLLQPVMVLCSTCLLLAAGLNNDKVYLGTASNA